MLGGSLSCTSALLAALAVEYFAGQRCYLQRTTNANVKSETSQKSQTGSKSPLVICVGLGQSARQYEHHYASRRRERDVLLYEPLGLGRPDPNNLSQECKDNGEYNCKLQHQAERLLETIRAAFDSEKVHLAGFSLGGRVALAAAVHDNSSAIKTLHLTGVSPVVSEFARVQLMAWKASLRRADDLDAFAWSALLASYSPAFLMRHQDCLSRWVEALCRDHTVCGIRSLLEQAYPTGDGDDRDADYTVASMMKLIQKRQLPTRWLLGADDRLASPDFPDCDRVLASVAHAVPMEVGPIWREDLDQFLATYDAF